MKKLKIVAAGIFISLVNLSLTFPSKLQASEVLDKEENYRYSHQFSLWSPTIKVSFFSDKENKEKYKNFSVITSAPFDGIVWKHYDGSSTHYYLSEADLEKSQDLREILAGFKSKEETFYRPNYEILSQDHSETNISTLVSSLQQAQVVSFSFGAGISQGYVPTLEEFCASFQLVKVPSSDHVTDESMKVFISNLLNDPPSQLKEVERLWAAIDYLKINSTPAHLALKNLIDLLQSEGKEVFVYTDNIDNIHYKCGILLSREKKHDPEEEGVLWESVLYPSRETTSHKNIVSLVIGQSFDFDGVHSHLFTIAPQTHFFSLNIKGEPFLIFQDLDLNNMPEEGIDVLALKKIPLPGVRLLQGSAHDLLPQIVNAYKQ